MSPSGQRKCAHCNQFFVPDARQRERQRHCAGPQCRRASKADANGKLLRAELQLNLDFLKKLGVTGVLALGRTGGFAPFNLEERKRALATVVELAAPLQVIVNVSDIRRGVGAFCPRARPADDRGECRPASSRRVRTTPWRTSSTRRSRHSCRRFSTTSRSSPARASISRPWRHLRMPVAWAGIKQSVGEFAYHKELITLEKEKDFVVFSGSVASPESNPKGGRRQKTQPPRLF